MLDRLPFPKGHDGAEIDRLLAALSPQQGRQAVTVNHPHGFFRTGTRRYTKRPPSNCRRAREAWDYHSANGPVVWLQLLDGYWGACRENGDIDECENVGALSPQPKKATNEED